MKTYLASAILGLSLTTAVQAEGQLNIYAWADSVAPALIEKFSKENDVKVNVDSFNSNEDLLTKLQAGSSGYDIATPSQHFLRVMIDQGLLESINASSLKAIANVEPKWLNQWWDDKQEYSVPFAYGTAGFVVNTKEYTGPTDSFKYFFEPDGALKGKIAMLSYPDEVIGAAQLYLGVPFCSEDQAEMKKVLDLLMAQKPSVAAYSSDNIDSRLASGEVSVHFWWDGNSLKARNSGSPVSLAMTKEGLVGWMDSLTIPKGAPNRDNAIKFIEFMSTPENATEQMNFYAHSSPMKLVQDKVEFTKEKAPELYPEVPITFSKTCSPAAQELVTRVWTQLLQ